MLCLQMCEQLKRCWDKWLIDRGKLITRAITELGWKIVEKGKI